jgi:hypothetical protein
VTGAFGAWELEGPAGSQGTKVLYKTDSIPLDRSFVLNSIQYFKPTSNVQSSSEHRVHLVSEPSSQPDQPRRRKIASISRSRDPGTLHAPTKSNVFSQILPK